MIFPPANILCRVSYWCNYFGQSRVCTQVCQEVARGSPKSMWNLKSELPQLTPPTNRGLHPLRSMQSAISLINPGCHGFVKVCFDFRIAWKHTLLTRGFVNFRGARGLENGGESCRLSGQLRLLNRGPKAVIGGSGGRSPAA